MAYAGWRVTCLTSAEYQRTSATSATFGIELTATSVEPTPVEPTT